MTTTCPLARLERRKDGKKDMGNEGVTKPVVGLEGGETIIALI